MKSPGIIIVHENKPKPVFVRDWYFNSSIASLGE